MKYLICHGGGRGVAQCQEFEATCHTKFTVKTRG